MREIGDIDLNDETGEIGGVAMELRRLKEGQCDPELALVDALVLSEVTSRSCKDVTALAR